MEFLVNLEPFTGTIRSFKLLEVRAHERYVIVRHCCCRECSGLLLKCEPDFVNLDEI